MSASIYDIPVEKISGEAASLSEFKGKVVLVVNVASKCGLTPQYEGLEKLYEKLEPQGLVVAGFPANDFKEQEPGTNDEIQSFCTLNYGVKFPLFSKITVTGPEKHPLYAALIAAQPAAVSVNQPSWREKLNGWGVPTLPEPELTWNFAVCSEIFSSAATCLFVCPRAINRKTSSSRAVNSSAIRMVSAGAAGGSGRVTANPATVAETAVTS